ncbi:BCS1 N terminal-domain-containing protein [Ephemerocybe angulata]|uniref:BCS1 N terminal-domain-containing protein n=1 Tax=Ephemerocybe angulata TaxID=980116 RepID=A0A8H6M6T2_9AGAR|nr:BCS1 N terminal-domain-containing protein [Tulosesus angulatus]
MDTLKSFMQPLMGGSSMVDGMKLVVLGGTVETARRVSSSAWSHFVNSFFLTAHFCEEEQPYDWLVLWLSRRPEWQRSREFEATLRAFSTASTASSTKSPADLEWEEAEREWESYNSSATTHHDGTPREPPLHIPGADDDVPLPEKPKSRIIFQPTYDTTHTIFFRGHWLRVKRQRKLDTGSEAISISVIARSNAILKQLVLQAKKEYEAECIHRIQIYFADAHGSWRWTDSRAKRPLGSIVLNPGVKEMLVEDTKDFLRSEKWYMDRGIPFRRGYLLYGVPGSGKSSLIHALAGYLQLDIYVVSLSASWISDSTLTSLMGRVPARCVVLLEDLDAAFTRSTSREDEEEALLNSLNSTSTSKNKSNSSNNNNGNDDSSGGFGSAFGYSSRRRNGHRSSGRNSGGDYLSDVNTLSLSGLLNALDGVAAAEGRLLFATTNHLEKLDPRSQPAGADGRLDRVQERESMAGGGALPELLPL